MSAASGRSGALADQILALSGPDDLIKCLKARVHLWAEAVRLTEWFADSDGLTTADRALASLFRDLGADHPVGAVSVA